MHLQGRLHPVIGPFSGVSIENLTDTPNLEAETVLTVSARDLVNLGQGMSAGEDGGEPVAVVTGDEFSLVLRPVLEPGDYGLVAEGRGPEGGSGSFWVGVDGDRLDVPLLVSTGGGRPHATGFHLDRGGDHDIRLALRGSGGSRVRSLQFRRMTVRVPREPMVQDLAGQHPRLFFGSEDLPALRARLPERTVKEFFRTAGVLEGDPPPFQPGRRNGGSFRGLPGYAISCVLEPSQEKLGRLAAWLEMAATYPHVGADLDAEYFMEGVALAYDWLYESLPGGLRAKVRDLLCRQAQHVYELSLNGRAGGGLSFQQNHTWFAHLSLALAASAVYGEVPRARQWLAWAWDRCERIFMTFSPDGGFHEGPAYWDFSMPALYMLIDLYERLTGLRVPAADQGLRGQAVFRLHHMYPGMDLTAPLEDTTTRTRRPPTASLLWEAKRYRDPVAMGIARMLNRDPGTQAFHLLWLDEGVPSQDPTAIVPLAQYYPDIETTFARTSWGPEATYLAAVSRPLGGHFWAGMCDRYGIGGTGHNHPAQGHFVLFGNGEVLAHDPGYTYEKRTRNHNTVLVDGQGQYGCGEMWPSPKPGRARMTGMAGEGDITILAADPSSAYPPELGLARFDRMIVLAGQGLAVIYDRLSAGQPRTFSWLLHHIGKAARVGEGPGWQITRGGAQLVLEPVLPTSIAAESSTYLPVYIHPERNHTPQEDAEIGLLELKSGPARETTFLVPMLIGEEGSPTPPVQDLSGNGVDAVRVGDTVVAFNRGEGEMAVPTPQGDTLNLRARAAVVTVRRGSPVVVTLGG